MPAINSDDTLSRTIEDGDFLLAARISDGQPSRLTADTVRRMNARWETHKEVMLSLWAQSSDISGGQIAIPTATWGDDGWDGADGPFYADPLAIPDTSTGSLYVSQGRAVKRGGVWSQTPWHSLSPTRLADGFVEWASDEQGEGATGHLDSSHTHYRARLGDGTWSPWERIVSSPSQPGWVTLVSDRDSYALSRGQGRNFSFTDTDLDHYTDLRVIAHIYDGHDSDGVRGETLGLTFADYPVSEITPLPHASSGYHAGKTIRCLFDRDTGGVLTLSQSDTITAGAYQSRVAFRMHFERPQTVAPGRLVRRAALKRISWTGQADHFSLSILVR